MAWLQYELQASWSLTWSKNGFYLNNNDASEEIDDNCLLSSLHNVRRVEVLDGQRTDLLE